MIDEIMTDMAEKSAMPTEEPIESEMRQWPQMFTVTEKQLPEIKEWEVGQAYSLHIEAIMKEERVDDDDRSASFVISKVVSKGKAEEQPKKKEDNKFILEEYFKYE